jgi:RelA/SpoT family (p)ppGpp synthetase
VSSILLDMHMDLDTLIAAILHDVLEDTAVTKEILAKTFGSEVAEIVDGVSKLTHLKFDSYEEKQAENFRKMMMAMSNDIRVILVKLADRTHNMRTIGALETKKRRRIARETLEIYTPIAQRLGMNSVRLELEELGFSTLYPVRHRVLSRQVKKSRGNRKEITHKSRNAIKRRLRQEKLSAEVLGREKHVYSLYKKMREQHLSFDEVFDVYGFRIIVEDVDMCYRALGVVHNLFRPVPGKFKDYIAIPKSNGYQSLHTVLFGPHGIPIEIQIRSKEMNEVAEAGIAAHWLYKSGKNAANNAHKRAREWLLRILEMQQQAGDSKEFLEQVKVDLFPDEIYVFTPQGEIMELPRGATAVDFAYAIHTDIGHTCVTARINRRLAPLKVTLETGQTVEIVTAPGAKPNPAWLNFVVSVKARTQIRHFLKNLKDDEALILGKRMINRELERFETHIDKISKQAVDKVLTEFNLTDLDDLLKNIGLGNRLATIVAQHLIPEITPHDDTDPLSRTPLAIRGTEKMVVNFPKCCHPIPGDKILGYVSSGRGIMIHRESCKNVAGFRNNPENWINVEWEPDVEAEYQVELQIEITNQRGALATIATAISNTNANIDDIDMSERDGRYVGLTFVISVHDRQHLAQVIKTVRHIKSVAKVTRTG